MKFKKLVENDDFLKVFMSNMRRYISSELYYVRPFNWITHSLINLLIYFFSPIIK